MKSVSIFSLLILNYTVFALNIGECIADPSSKRYLNNVFYDKYPKTFIFECTYDCLSNEGVDKVLAVSKAVSYNLKDDAGKVVCEGVRVKEIPYGFEFDKVIPFYSHQTRTKEIKVWASKKIPVFSNSSIELLGHFYRQIEEVARVYKVAGESSLFFKEASDILFQIVRERNEKKLLREYLKLLEKRLEVSSIGHELTSENLVLKSLYAHGYWMLPNYVKK